MHVRAEPPCGEAEQAGAAADIEKSTSFERRFLQHRQQRSFSASNSRFVEYFEKSLPISAECETIPLDVAALAGMSAFGRRRSAEFRRGDHGQALQVDACFAVVR